MLGEVNGRAPALLVRDYLDALGHGYCEPKTVKATSGALRLKDRPFALEWRRFVEVLESQRGALFYEEAGLDFEDNYRLINRAACVAALDCNEASSGLTEAGV